MLALTDQAYHGETEIAVPCFCLRVISFISQCIKMSVMRTLCIETLSTKHIDGLDCFCYFQFKCNA